MRLAILKFIKALDPSDQIKIDPKIKDLLKRETQADIMTLLTLHNSSADSKAEDCYEVVIKLLPEHDQNHSL